MGYPPPQDPYGQSGPQGPYQPQPYGQPQPPYPQQQPYPPQPYPAQPPYGYPQQPMHVQQVGRSVTKPAWSVGEICLVVFTCGVAWPFVWMSRRSRTTVTRHR